MVLIPNTTPNFASMASPARIMMALSMNPKPIKGMAFAKPTSNRSRLDGACTVPAATLTFSIAV